MDWHQEQEVEELMAQTVLVRNYGSEKAYQMDAQRLAV